jgi:hypothetical protein
MIELDATRSGREARHHRGAPACRTVQTVLGAIGNRRVAALARAPQGRRRLQRLILAMEAPDESHEDVDKLVTGANFLSKKPDRGERVKVEPDGTGLEKLKGVRESEPIYLVAHSEGKLVWSLDPAAMAAKLFTYLPDGYKGTIKLVACHTGKQRASKERYRGLGETTTYAQELAYELLQLQGASSRGVAIRSVHGRPGIATIDPVTGKRRVYASSQATAAVDTAFKAWVDQELAGDRAALVALKAVAEKLDARMKELTAVAIPPELIQKRDAADAAADEAIAAVDAKQRALNEAEGWVTTFKNTKQVGTWEAKRDEAAKSLKKAEEAREAAVQVISHLTDRIEELEAAHRKKLKSNPEMVDLKTNLKKLEAQHEMLEKQLQARRHDVEKGEAGTKKLSELQVTVGGALGGKAADVGYAVAAGVPTWRRQPAALPLAVEVVEEELPPQREKS